ncbi:MAG TPA: hypothetical protein VMG10_27160 [Gemmataceae bacterium]|nr:hypothetical protein [Gemmataceae bacterium]
MSLACVVLRAHIYLVRRQLAAARTLLAGAIARRPRSAAAFGAGVHAYAARDQPRCRRAGFLKTLELDSATDEAIYLLARLHRRVGLRWRYRTTWCS